MFTSSRISSGRVCFLRISRVALSTLSASTTSKFFAPSSASMSFAVISLSSTIITRRLSGPLAAFSKRVFIDSSSWPMPSLLLTQASALAARARASSCTGS